MAFENFLKDLENEDQAAKLRNMFDWIESQYPELTPVVKWNQPMYSHEGTFIIGFSTAKAHFSVGLEGPVIRKFENRIAEAGYSYSKMIYRIKWTEAIDYNLLGDIIEFQKEDKAGLDRFWR